MIQKGLTKRQKEINVNLFFVQSVYYTAMKILVFPVVNEIMG